MLSRSVFFFFFYVLFFSYLFYFFSYLLIKTFFSPLFVGCLFACFCFAYPPLMVCSSNPKVDVESFCTVMELCDGGDLDEYLRGNWLILYLFRTYVIVIITFTIRAN